MNISDYIVNEFKHYNSNIAIINALQDEDIYGCKAQTLSDMPTTITNQFNSET